MLLWYSNTCGAPGGGIVMPLCIVFLKFDAKNAVALSNFSLFLSSFIRYFYMIRLPHPLKSGKGRLIDYNTFLISFPLLVSGVSFGVILNIIMPSIVINIFYLLLSSTLAFYMLYKSCILKKNEKKALKI